MGRDREVDNRSSRVKNFELDLEWLRGIYIRRGDAQQIDSQFMRVALVWCTISHAETAVTTANTTRAFFTIRLRCRRVPEFRALTKSSEVDIFDFLRPQETRQGEQKEQKSSSK